MIKAIFLAIFLCFAALGITEAIHFLFAYLKSPKVQPREHTILFIDKKHWEAQLDYIISEILWNKYNSSRIIVVKPKEVYINNQEKIEKNYNIFFCEKEDLRGDFFGEEYGS